MDNSFPDYLIFTVELPVSKQKRHKVTEAKLKEVKNLEDHEVFEEIVNYGLETIGSH